MKRLLVLLLIPVIVMAAIVGLVIYNKKPTIIKPQSTQKPIVNPTINTTPPKAALPGTFIASSETLVSQNGSRTYTLSCRYEVNKDQYIEVDKGQITTTEDQAHSVLEDQANCTN